MKKRVLLLAVLALAFATAMTFAAGTAVANPLPPTPANLQIGYNYPGAATWYGTTGLWVNQDFSIVATPTMYLGAPVFGPSAFDTLGYTLEGGPLVDITSDWQTRKFTTEGMYQFDAVVTTAAVTWESTGSVLGLDKHRPWSWSNAVPVFDSPAVISITATDALSGACFIATSLDGAPDWNSSLSPYTGVGALTTTVTVSTPGRHTLRWFSVDRGGNHEFTHSISFVVNAAGYTPVLGKPKAYKLGNHNVRISGSVTPAATDRNVWVTVMRRVSGRWTTYASYKVTVPKYTSSWTTKKWLQKDGAYRFVASEGTGISPASNSVTLH